MASDFATKKPMAVRFSGATAAGITVNGVECNREVNMDIVNGVNIVTAAIVLTLAVLFNRIFRGDVGTNRAASVGAFVVLLMVLFWVRSEGGKAFIDHIVAIMR